MWLKIHQGNEVSYINLSKCSDIHTTESMVSFHEGESRLGTIAGIVSSTVVNNILNAIDQAIIQQRPLTTISILSD